MIHVFSSSPYCKYSDVADTLKSGWFGHGKVVDSFVKLFAEHANVDVDHLVPLASCTDGIFIVMRLLNLNPYHVVVAPTIHFSAVGQAVLSSGCKLFLCDVDRYDLMIRPSDVINVHDDPKAIFVLHYGGYPCNVQSLKNVFPESIIIEDAATAVNTRVNGELCGTMGNFGLWSFDPVKQISAPHGGMLWCRDREMADRARCLSCLGQTVSSGLSNTSNERWWEFDIKMFGGRNARWDDVSASIALPQLQNIHKSSELLKEMVACYSSNLKHKVAPFDEETTPFFTWISVENRDELAVRLRENGIYTTFRYWPLHKQTITKCSDNNFPVAEEVSRTTLLLPLHTRLTHREIDTVIDTVNRYS
jgi:aminotransferase